jgi:hypothetical protein
MSDKVTYHDVMSGVWGSPSRSALKYQSWCYPRKSAPIRLPKVDRKAAFAKIVAQNKGEV